MTSPLRDAAEFWRLGDVELLRLRTVARHADRVELKLLVTDTACTALGADLDGARTRHVSFLDTPDLALADAGVVVRVRHIAGRPDDSVVKLRPVVPRDLPARVRRSKSFVLDVDGMPGGYVCSGALKAQLGSDDVARATAGLRPLKSLFSKPQRALLSAHAPAGVDLGDLALLGPIEVRRRKLPADRVGVPLTVERWTFPDGSQIHELSTRCTADRALEVAAARAAGLRARGVRPTDTQLTKTRAALDFFFTTS
jgi:hypothetical protein